MMVKAPVRATHTYVQHLVAPPGEVFPLLCPVREMDWVPGWEPGVVISASGVAERDCVFTTPDGEHEAIWTIVEHDPEAHAVEMLKVTPGYTVTRLRITLAPEPDGTAATITYSYTALSEEGERFVATRTPEAYEAFMREWEEQMNRYLLATS
jgi:hypothetical protein